MSPSHPIHKDAASSGIARKVTAKAIALVVAAGRGSRLSTPNDDNLPKQYRQIDGKPILARTLSAFLDHPCIAAVRTVIHPDDAALYEEALSDLSEAQKQRLLAPVLGGATRQASVRNGLTSLRETEPDFVLIHDAARPFVSPLTIDRILTALEGGDDAVLAAAPVFDTMKRGDTQGFSIGTVDRDNLWAAQTPQAFAFERILAAHDAAAASSHTTFTDDTAVAEWAGMKVRLVESDIENFKITTAADLERAERKAVMNSNTVPAPTSAASAWAGLDDIRVGTGYDVHAFADGDAVILGGISVPHDHRLSGHSDADVVLHAITDAILGAIADKDIGAHFPPSDPQWKGAASDKFLLHALNLVAERGGRLAHIDATVVCEAPKIGPVREAMRESIAEICKISIGRVSVKATTSERLGFTGRKEGIAAIATATVRLPFTD